MLDGTPFRDYTYPALLLGVVVGGSALAAAAIAVFGPRRFETLASAAAGCILAGWIVVQLLMLGFQTPVQPLYLLFGLVMIVLAGLLQMTKRTPRPQVTA